MSEQKSFHSIFFLSWESCEKQERKCRRNSTPNKDDFTSPNHVVFAGLFAAFGLQVNWGDRGWSLVCARRQSWPGFGEVSPKNVSLPPSPTCTTWSSVFPMWKFILKIDKKISAIPFTPERHGFPQISSLAFLQLRAVYCDLIFKATYFCFKM